MADFVKPAGAVLDYELNWATWLASGETISSSSWSVETGLTEDSESNTTTTAKVWVSGGTVGKTYTATNTITTSDSRTDARVITIYISPRKADES